MGQSLGGEPQFVGAAAEQLHPSRNLREAAAAEYCHRCGQQKAPGCVCIYCGPEEASDPFDEPPTRLMAAEAIGEALTSLWQAALYADEQSAVMPLMENIQELWLLKFRLEGGR